MNMSQCVTVTRAYNASLGAKEFGEKMAEEGKILARTDVDSAIEGFWTFSNTHRCKLRDIARSAYHAYIKDTFSGTFEGLAKLKIEQLERELARAKSEETTAWDIVRDYKNFTGREFWDLSNRK